MDASVPNRHLLSSDPPETPHDATQNGAAVPGAPARNPKGRGFATVSVILGTLGMLASSLAFVLVAASVSSASDSMRGANNPLAVSGAAIGIAMGVVAFALPVIAIVFPMNCLGLVLGGVGVCRANGRELGLLGLLLNGVPVLLCCWGLRALVSAL